VTDQTDAATKQALATAEHASARVREQAEALRASIASSERLNAATQKAKVQAKHVQEEAAKRGHQLGEEAAVRGKKAARIAAKEAKKRGAQAKAQAPVVAATALEKGAQALEVARERGGEALLAALETDTGKKLAHTPAGAALKSKLPARKRRRRKFFLLLLVPAAAAAAFKALSAKRGSGTGASSDPYGDAPIASPAAPPASSSPTDTVAPGTAGTAAGEPIGGVVEPGVAEEAVANPAEQEKKP
jgi:hypothetical protein